jgi:D-alanyl-D-alanine carboxypeptidase
MPNTRQLEHGLRELVRNGRVPGIQYVAVDSTMTLIDFCGGFAELPGRLMSADTTMMAYSMSKTITAAAVLQLVERRKLGIDDGISKYLSWQPYGDAVTVRQLLSHTAGIPSPIPLRWVHPVDAGPAFDEDATLRGVVRRHPRLSATPGTRFAYSNIGYWLLGALIEQITGQSFSSYVDSQLFAPLGLVSHELAYVIREQGTHATGYLERPSLINLMRPFFIGHDLIGERRGRWLEIRPHYVNGPAFGGIVGRAKGFARFLQDQLGDRSCLFGEHTRSLLLEQQRTSRGDIPMTLGFHIGSLAAHTHYFKEGGGGGFHSMMRLYKEQGIGTVLMVNATTFNVSKALDVLDAPLLAA